MTIELDQAVRRVIADVFDTGVVVTLSEEPRSPQIHRVELIADGRRAGLRASCSWLDITIFDIGVSATVFNEDDDPAEREAALRAMARVAHAYLRGEGTVERRWGLFGSHPVLHIEVEGRDWVLGRRVSRVPLP